MFTFNCFIIILFGLSLVCLSECSKHNNHTMRIELTRQKTAREQYLNAPDLSKFGISHDWLYKKHNDTNRTTDSIALRRYLDHEFYGTVVIGHPGQTLNVAFDTAWTISWVISSKCFSFKHFGCWFHNKYDHTISSEYKKDGRPYIGNEGTYNLTGFYSYDNFSVAHVNVTAMSFVEMDSVPFSSLFSKVDGVVGLAPQADSYEPFFYKLLKQKKIKDPIFSVYLNRDRQSTRGGNILLGLIDHKHIHKNRVGNQTIPENITYLPVDPGQFWKFPLDKIYVAAAVGPNEKPFTLCDNGCRAISDTSSNTIIGPEDEVAKIHDAIKAKPFFFDRSTVECDTVNKLPKIDFLLGGKNFTLTGPQYVVKMSYKAITLCFSSFVADNTPNQKGLWVLGGAFLSEYYSIYNIHDKQIGFVKAA